MLLDDVLAVEGAVVETGREKEGLGGVRQEVQDLVAAGGILDQDHAQAVPVDVEFLHAPEAAGELRQGLAYQLRR